MHHGSKGKGASASILPHHPSYAPILCYVNVRAYVISIIISLLLLLLIQIVVVVIIARSVIQMFIAATAALNNPALPCPVPVASVVIMQQ